MEHLIKLIEKRKEIGLRPAALRGGDIKDLYEYQRVGDLIIEEACRLYEAGKLN